MQVTSLLAKNDELPSTKTYWWKRRKPDYIDVSEIKPNPIVAWFKSVKWLKVFAILIQRLARCWDRTEPGGWMLAATAVVCGVMFTAMPYSFREPTPTFMQGLWHCIWFSAFLVVLAEALLYLCWEMVQGFKWLHAWANRNHPNPYEKD